jgi:hypothetical protein
VPRENVLGEEGKGIALLQMFIPRFSKPHIKLERFL